MDENTAPVQNLSDVEMPKNIQEMKDMVREKLQESKRKLKEFLDQCAMMDSSQNLG